MLLYVVRAASGAYDPFVLTAEAQDTEFSVGSVVLYDVGHGVHFPFV